MRAAETMAVVAQSYLTYQSGHLRPRSYVEVERHLMRYCKPLHGQQLAKIDRRTVAARISDVANNSGAVTANRMRATLVGIFRLGGAGRIARQQSGRWHQHPAGSSHARVC